MGGTVLETIGYIITVVIILAPPVVAIVWVVWEACLLPASLSKSEIVEQADAMIDAHGDRAESVVSNRELDAWHRSNLADQGKWRRVRREIKRRQERD